MYDMINKFTRGKQFFLRLIITLFITAITPMLIISLLSYINTKVTMKNKLIEMEYEYLNQTVNAIEISVTQIRETCRQVTLDGAFTSFSRYDNFKFLEENMMEEINGSDLRELSSYIMDKARIYDRLSSIKTLNELIESVYLFDMNKNMVYTDERNQYEMSSFYDKEILGPIEKNTVAYYALIPRLLKYESGKERNAISFIYRTAGSSGDYIFVMNMETTSVYSNLINRITSNRTSNFFVLSEDKKIILDSSLEYIGKDSKVLDSLKNLKNIKNGTFITKQNLKDILISIKKSDKLNWYFINVSDMEAYNRSVNYSKLLIAITLTAMLLLIIILVPLSGKKIYTPIDRMVKYVLNKTDNRNVLKTEEQYNELKLIEENLQQAFFDRDSLQAELCKILPVYVDKFIISIIKNGCNSLTEASDRMKELRINLESENLYLMNMIVDNPAIDIELYKEISIDAVVLNILDEMIHKMNKGTYVRDETGRYYIVLNCEYDELKRVFNFAADVKNQIFDKTGFSIKIGIGIFCKDITELKRAYNESIYSLQYSILKQNEDIVYIDDITVGIRKDNLKYPTEIEELLFNYVRVGDEDNSEKTFLVFLKKISEHEGILQYGQVQSVFIRLLSVLIELVQEMGIEMDELYPEYNKIYIELFEYKETMVIERFKEIIKRAAGRNASMMTNRNSIRLKVIFETIDRNIGNNISLTSVAEQLNLNPDYVSKILKEQTGKTFSEYLTWVRMEMGKKLLSETDMKVREISDMLGYSNSNYFIKLFKDFTGTTPGEYKKFVMK